MALRVTHAARTTPNPIRKVHEPPIEATLSASFCPAVRSRENSRPTSRATARRSIAFWMVWRVSPLALGWDSRSRRLGGAFLFRADEAAVANHRRPVVFEVFPRGALFAPARGFFA